MAGKLLGSVDILKDSYTGSFYEIYKYKYMTKFIHLPVIMVMFSVLQIVAYFQIYLLYTYTILKVDGPDLGLFIHTFFPTPGVLARCLESLERSDKENDSTKTTLALREVHDLKIVMYYRNSK